MPSCLAKLGRVGCVRPAKMPLEEAREVRDEIKSRVLELIERINGGHRKRNMAAFKTSTPMEESLTAYLIVAVDVASTAAMSAHGKKA